MCSSPQLSVLQLSWQLSVLQLSSQLCRIRQSPSSTMPTVATAYWAPLGPNLCQAAATMNNIGARCVTEPIGRCLWTITTRSRLCRSLGSDEPKIDRWVIKWGRPISPNWCFEKLYVLSKGNGDTQKQQISKRTLVHQMHVHQSNFSNAKPSIFQTCSPLLMYLLCVSIRVQYFL